LAFSNALVCELAEACAVAEYLQPDYVDRAGMYDRAVRHLSSIGAGAVPLLVELLGNDETSVAKGAAFALAGIGNEAIGGLRWAILFGNARVRVYALQGLSAMKAAVPLTDDLLNLVATVLAGDSHAMVKDAAIALLADTNHAVAVEALKRALSEGSFTGMLAESALERLDTPYAQSTARFIGGERRWQHCSLKLLPLAGFNFLVIFSGVVAILHTSAAFKLIVSIGSIFAYLPLPLPRPFR
jgi:hypothetical protein